MKMIPLNGVQTSRRDGDPYPFTLLAHYSLDFYRNNTLAEESKGLELFRNPMWVMISKKDAKKLGLDDGDDVKIHSRAGMVKGISHISDSVPEGILLVELIWSQQGDYSTSNLLFPKKDAVRSDLHIPVKIERGE